MDDVLKEIYVSPKILVAREIFGYVYELIPNPIKAELVEYTSVTSSREMRVIQAIKMIN